MNEPREQEMILRKTFVGQKDPKHDVMITVRKPSDGTCNCKWKGIHMMPAPDWLKDPVCAMCSSPAEPSKFYVGGKAVLVKIDNEEPKPYCDKCRPKLFEQCQSGCRHVFLESEKSDTEEPEKVQWRNKIEWSITGEKWYSVRYDNIKTYLPYPSSVQELGEKLSLLHATLNDGKPLKVKARYNKETKVLEVNGSTF